MPETTKQFLQSLWKKMVWLVLGAFIAGLGAYAWKGYGALTPEAADKSYVRKDVYASETESVNDKLEDITYELRELRRELREDHN